MGGIFIFRLIIRGCEKSSNFLLLLFFFLNTCWATNAFAQEWLEKKSRHVIVYYQEKLASGYAKEVLSRTETYYKTIINNLGFRRFDFWTWDNRCKIFLYSSQEKYYNGKQRPHWSGGQVNIRERAISSWVEGEGFLDSVLPHEMGHLIFREFVGYQKKLPLWLDEGIACFGEIKSRPERLRIARSLVKSKMYIPLEKLTRMNDSKVIILPTIFYAQAASVVNFLLKSYGKNGFLDFSREIRDGEDWQEALRKIYGFKDIFAMEKAWTAYLKDEN